MGIRIEVAERAPAPAVQLIAEQATGVDGTAPLGEQPLRNLEETRDGLVHVLAWEGDDVYSTLVGYGQIDGTGEGASAEMVVAPESRRQGIGSRIVRTIFEREPGTALWAHGNLEAAEGMAVDSGLVRGRELLIMRRVGAEAGPLEEPTAPDGVEFGTFAEAGARWPELDVEAEMLRVNNAAFAWHPEQGGWTAEQLSDRLSVDWVDSAAIFLAVDVSGDAPTMLGFHWTKTHPADADSKGEGKGEGEVYVVGVDPAAQGEGLGSKLTVLGVRHLEAAGVPAVILYVEGDNLPARRTYERLGFAVAHRDVTYVSA